MCIISGDDCLLRCCTVSLVEVYRRFRGACFLHHHGYVEEESTSETSVNYQITRRNILEGCNLHTRRRENLKSHNEDGVVTH
jgi:hypothetical protein